MKLEERYSDMGLCMYNLGNVPKEPPAPKENAPKDAAIDDDGMTREENVREEKADSEG